MSRPLRVTIALFALALAIAAAGCRGTSAPSAETTSTPAEEVAESEATTLPAVEVQSYRGMRLDARDQALQENSIKGPQEIDRAKWRLRVDGLVNEPRTFTYRQVTSLRPAFRKAVTLNCVEGWSATLLWQGVRVEDVLAEAGGAKASAEVVIFHARDGYTSSLPLAYLEDRDILLAYRQNGLPLSTEWGWPLQLVAEDKWGYKWVKWIDRIEVSADAGYRGYWERRGYSNDGDLDKGSLGR